MRFCKKHYNITLEAAYSLDPVAMLKCISSTVQAIVDLLSDVCLCKAMRIGIWWGVFHLISAQSMVLCICQKKYSNNSLVLSFFSVSSCCLELLSSFFSIPLSLWLYNLLTNRCHSRTTNSIFCRLCICPAGLHFFRLKTFQSIDPFSKFHRYKCHMTLPVYLQLSRGHQRCVVQFYNRKYTVVYTEKPYFWMVMRRTGNFSPLIAWKQQGSTPPEINSSQFISCYITFNRTTNIFDSKGSKFVHKLLDRS